MAACPRLCAAQTIRFSSFKAIPPTVGTMLLNIIMSKTFQNFEVFRFQYPDYFDIENIHQILKREDFCYDR